MEAQESLAIIESMIVKSKKNFSHSAKYFLLWGWAVFLTVLAQYILLKLLYTHTYYVWITMPVCAVVSIFMSVRDSKRVKVKTYVGDAMSALWFSMMFAFFALAFIAVRMEVNVFPIVLILYGIGTMTSGSLLDFRPLTIGGVFAFVMSIACTFVEGSATFLVMAAAILVSYIIPGHLLLKADNNV